MNNGAPPRWQRKGRSGGAVMLEGYVEVTEGGQKRSEGGEEMVGRTKSLTDDDLEELRGCLDLGFGFVYEEIPELCNTLPALELCYSMSQKFLDEQQQKHSSAVAGEVGAPSTAVANWKISSPGDHPDDHPDVKARPILHRYANEDVSLGSWLLGLDVQHIDDRTMCCGTPPDCEWKMQAGNVCVASFDWSCSGICKSVDKLKDVHSACGEGDSAIWNVSI